MSRLEIAIYDEGSSPSEDIGQKPTSKQLQSPLIPRCGAGLPLFSYHPVEPRPALGNVTNKGSTTRKLDEGGAKMLGTPTSKAIKSHRFKKTFVELTSEEEIQVDDPHFILGVIEVASEQE